MNEQSELASFYKGRVLLMTSHKEEKKPFFLE